MTAQIIQFPGSSLARLPVAPIVMPVIEGEIVSDLTPPLANRVAHLPCRKPRRQRAKMRVEQVEVTCERVPRKQHRDLRTLRGVLTLDWKGDVPWTATFDPHDENIPNIVAPIEKLTHSFAVYEIATDEGVWGFTVVTESDDDESDDDEEG